MNRRPERARIIVSTARMLLDRYGIQGTTIARIAEEAGMSQGGIYRHFPSRTDILVAAVEEIFEQIYALYDAEPGTDPLQRIRTMVRRHMELMSDPARSFARPWLEIVAAAPRVGLREVVLDRQLKAAELLRSIIGEGMEAGSIRSDVDPERLSWQILTWAWGENVASAMDLSDPSRADHSAQLIWGILDAAAQGTPGR